MKTRKGWYLGAALLGVLLTLFAGPAFARVLGRMYGNSLHIENEPRSSTAGRFTLGNDDGYIKGDLEVDGSVYLDGEHFSVVPATETISAAGTITANACGGLKRINSVGDVTTGTTNTLTAPSSSNAGCRMLIVNVDTVDTIYLDSNALFGVTSAASLPIGPKGSISVWSDGSVWWHGAWTEY